MAKELRYEEASQDSYDLLDAMLAERFPELASAKIKILFDVKKHVLRGRLALAQIYLADQLTRFLTADEVNTTGADYVIFLDKACWTKVATADDKARIISHELRHTRVTDSKKMPYHLVGHDIEDFVAEVKLNSEEPGWRNRLFEAVAAMYESEEEDQKE